MDGSTFDSSNASTITAIGTEGCKAENGDERSPVTNLTDCNLHMHQMELD